MSNFNPMNTAPLNGTSVLLESDGDMVQASYHFGKWELEKNWTDKELRSPSPILNPTGWKPL